MLEGFWYSALESRLVTAGRPAAAMLMNQPLVLFRDQAGQVHALDDRCVHRGALLSGGWQEGNTIRCPFHGWRYAATGECVEVPALAGGTIPPSACVRSYYVQEQDGWVWVYMGNERCPKPTAPPPALPVPPDGSRMISARQSMEVKVRFDLAVDSLTDPAHVPFVHNKFFRQQRVAKLKEKIFTRLPMGFRTVSHKVALPNTFIFRALSLGLHSATTTVDFLLPGVHAERLEVGQRFASVLLIATPLTTDRTRLDITVGRNFLLWLPADWLIRRVVRTTLGQDRDVLELQERGHHDRTTMLLGFESDTTAVWVRKLKKYHLDQMTGQSNLSHPIPEQTTLHWKT